MPSDQDPHDDNKNQDLEKDLDIENESGYAPTQAIALPEEDEKWEGDTLPACIVVINSPFHNLVGLNLDLDKPVLTVGRSSENHLVLDEQWVSRKHCEIYLIAGRVRLRDLGSINGTKVNGQQLKKQSRILRHRDRVGIGDTELLFLQGADLEIMRRQTLDQLSTIDGLSGAFSKQAFEAMVAKQIRRSDKDRTPFCVLMTSLDDLARLNETHGRVCGDHVLREFAELMKHRLRNRDVLGRMGGGALFGIMMVDVSLSLAIELAERLRVAVEEHEFQFEDHKIPITVTIGVAQHLFGLEINELMRAADDALYTASRAGRNCVKPLEVDYDGHTTARSMRSLRRVLDGEAVLRKALTAETVSSIIGFEIEDEDLLLQNLGVEGREKWMRELEDDVIENTDFDEPVGTWLGRYTIAALKSSRNSSPNDTLQTVVENWCKRPVPDEMSEIVTRNLRAVVMPPEEVSRLQERTLNELIGRLVKQRSLHQDSKPDSVMPFPLAAPLAITETRRNGLVRVKSLTDAIEMALRFVVAVELSVLRDTPDLRDELASLLAEHGDRVLTMGSWEKLAWQCAALQPKVSGKISCIFRAFAQTNGKPTKLSKRIKEAVEKRNRVTHGMTLADAAYQEEEAYLHSLLDDLIDALQPLAQTKLVSVVEMISYDEDAGEGTYDIYMHNGPAEHFPIARTQIPSLMGRKEWCYLIDEDRGKPLLLAPVVAAMVCPTCQRNEVFMADRVTMGPSGKSIHLHGVATNHKVTTEIPNLRNLLLLHEAVTKKRTDG